MKSYILYFIVFFVTILLVSCETKTFNELTEDALPEEEVITYVDNIKPVLDAQCIICHSPGGAASFAPFTNYQEASERINQILDRVQRPTSQPGAMPPNGPQLPQNIIDLFISWEEDGLVEE